LMKNADEMEGKTRCKKVRRKGKGWILLSNIIPIVFLVSHDSRKSEEEGCSQTF
jgi:hypothetical protein